MKRKESSGGADYPMMRPKRQAPPPPVIRGVSIDQGDRLEEQSCREPPQGAEVMVHVELRIIERMFQHYQPSVCMQS